jgi:hypothetical protein
MHPTRVIGLVVLIDGTISAVYGHDFIRWLMARLPRPLRLLVAPFKRVPQPLFRTGAILQSLAGAYLLLREARASSGNPC